MLRNSTHNLCMVLTKVLTSKCCSGTLWTLEGDMNWKKVFDNLVEVMVRKGWSKEFAERYAKRVLR
jgi:hypothetical protein